MPLIEGSGHFAPVYRIRLRTLGMRQRVTRHHRMKPPSQVGNGENYPSIDSPNRAWRQLDSSWRSAPAAGRTQMLDLIYQPRPLVNQSPNLGVPNIASPASSRNVRLTSTPAGLGKLRSLLALANGSSTLWSRSPRLVPGPILVI